ncbi:hypothetical protein Ancab_001448 [Ancistrocladus abbreviatus]
MEVHMDPSKSKTGMGKRALKGTLSYAYVIRSKVRAVLKEDRNIDGRAQHKLNQGEWTFQKKEFVMELKKINLERALDYKARPIGGHLLLLTAMGDCDLKGILEEGLPVYRKNPSSHPMWMVKQLSTCNSPRFVSNDEDGGPYGPDGDRHLLGLRNDMCLETNLQNLVEALDGRQISHLGPNLSANPTINHPNLGPNSGASLSSASGHDVFGPNYKLGNAPLDRTSSVGRRASR